MQYHYQIDYGNGYEDVFRDLPEGGEMENPSQWLAEVETETAACRARVRLGDEIIEERDFTCAVTQTTVAPDGSAEYSVRCSGGNVTVRRNSGGELTGEAQSGYAGETDVALARAIEAVRKLGKV